MKNYFENKEILNFPDYDDWKISNNERRSQIVNLFNENRHSIAKMK